MTHALKVIAFEARGGPHDGGQFVVGDHRVIVGSDHDCDFVLAEPEVAGEHASFKQSGTHVEVHDLGTHSGTFVNGARIAAPTLVSVGDEVKIGSTVLTEVVKEEEPATVPAEEPAAAPVAAAAAVSAEAIQEAPAATPAAPTTPPPAAPTTPPPAAPPKRGPDVRGPHGRRNIILIGAGVVALLAAIVVGVVLATSGGGPLTMQQIITKDKPSTLMVVSRSRAVSPVTGASGLFAGGSAWVYDANRGLIITNAHVLQGGDTFEAGYAGSDLTTATVVGVDARDDIAILHIAPGDLPGLKSVQRASGSAAQGAKVYVLGYPGNATSQTDFLRTPFQANDGTITATGVRANVNTDAWGDPRNDNAALLLSNLNQTTAVINAGASGGPLVNDQGQLVGMNVASGKEAQHYAIPLSTINSIVPQLAQGRSIGWLGIGVSALPSQVANAWSIDGGMIITSVVKDTPADQTKLPDYLAFASKSPFDYLVLAYVNGVRVTSMQSYVNTVSQLQSGQQATVRVGRFSPNGNYHGYRDFKITVP